MAELDGDAGRHEVPLVGRGHPVDVALVHEAAERVVQCRVMAEALEQRREELLGGIGAEVADPRHALVLHQPGDQVEDGGARAGRRRAGAKSGGITSGRA